ncbi:MAG: TRAP transporter substrate-binding protein DctP [Burkholderiaceae bacterium]|nr:TRAP transporter substrate-binding protein DctP [Rhodoferax sp.]MCB2007350.1 TRAP transporter substrate-binding protein DctP [Rhodoferax sp.]MCB2029454.1 TRAP transporter substrate-binding protein DctP [Rhodoferax sp.]MCB2040813.1 TRAP transporter substrate-binding protein DctP [Rhodoferax sp.]MCP5263280.1 TRAP transporter substrate-binding protein DctP [Rhodoferax sp.]
MRCSKRVLPWALGLALCAGAAQAEVNLRYTEPSVNRGERADAMNWFADEVAKRSKGEVKITFFWGGTLADAKTSLKTIGDGAADMGSIVAAYSPREMLPYAVGDLPIGSSDTWVGVRAMHELSTTNADVKKAFDDANVVYLGNFTTTPVQVICKDKVLSKVEDIKGIKIRATGFYGQVLEDLGATVLRFSGVDAGRSMDAGTINCNMNYLYGMRSLRDYENAQELSRLDWGGFLAWAVVMNKNTFNKLTPDQQKLLRETGAAMTDKVGQLMMDASDNAVKAMTAGIDGKVVKVHNFPASERAKLVAAGKKYEEDWKKKTKAAGYNPDTLIADYLAATAKFEKERETKGYPWKR